MGILKMIMLLTNCPSLKRVFKLKAIFVSMEMQQPDLALRRDALECMSEEVSPDAVLCLLTEAGVT